MKFSLLLLTAAHTALATVSYGTNTYYNTHAAWIDGDNPCDTVTDINNLSDNPCGISFTLSNGYSYKLEYCGTSSFALYNSDGSYNHKCDSSTELFYCTAGIIQRQWNC